MKIALSVDSLSDRLTGIGRYTWELLNGLRADDRVTQLSYIRNGMVLSDPALLLTTGTFKPSWPLRTARRLQGRFGLKGALFHGPNYFLPDFVDGGVVTIHDLSVLKYPETHPIERIQAFERNLASTIKRTAHFITDCEHVRREIIDWFGIRGELVTAVPLGVDRKFQPYSPNECRATLARYGISEGGFILCVSTLEPRKGLANAIRSYRLAGRSVGGRPLVLVGASGWNNLELKDLIAEEAAKGDVLPLGYVSDDDLPYIYASAGLFVFPSVYEGFGLPPLEAMASGVPAIVSNHSCMPEVTKGAAMYVDPFDTEALARAMEKGLTDEYWRSEAIARGLTVASSYTWADCCDRTIAVYKEVAEH